MQRLGSTRCNPSAIARGKLVASDIDGGKKRPPGYHMGEIKKGTLGEISKIQEELDELIDAHLQGNRIMVLAEAADLYGALEAFIVAKFPGFTMEELRKMSDATKRAFQSGRRS